MQGSPIVRLRAACNRALGIGADASRSRSPLVAVVGWCALHAWLVIVLALALTAFSGVYAARHFAIKTDINDLFPRDLAWTERAFAYMKAFPQHDVLVVIEAPTSEFADAAAAKLGPALAADREHFRSVEQTQGGPFFAQNGLLFLPAEEVARLVGDLQKAAPLLGSLNTDPSLRGALGALSYGVMGVANGIYSLNSLAGPMTMAADTVDDALAGRKAYFSWRALAGGKPPEPAELRRFIQIAPVVDFNALEPGRAAIDAIRQTADRLNLAGDLQARVRVTGLVPINDDQFATLTEHAALNGGAGIIAVIIILWLALRSWRIIVAALVSVLCGLAMTAALGLYLVGALNLMSVAFFVLFVGLGVDFGIQFSVRYRAERHESDALHPALVSAAKKAGGPLALAAVATALGFSAFLPTDYRGLGELGEIAGPGMIIAFLTSITVLPALLAVLKPPGEPRPMGFAGLAPIDRFLVRHRIAVVVVTLAAVVLASPLLMFLPFDFDPIHMSNPRAQSVATFLELRRDPQTGANAIEILAPNTGAAEATAQKLMALPEVSRATTLASFVPADQDKKLALLRQLAPTVGRELSQGQPKPPPTDQQNVEALLSTGISLSQFAAMSSGPGADAANRLFRLLLQLANADQATRERVAAALVVPLQMSLVGLRDGLTAQPVTAESIPPDIKRAWLAPDGGARVQVLPKGDPNDTAVLRDFVRAVLAAAPDATGPAVLLYEAANTIVRALIEAGIFALAGIALLLWITLRRLSDVALTLVPLLLAAVVTLELCVVIDLPLNFANIIALPLLLGVGVAFKIYYIMAWRRGRTALVQSTLSRAVIFSAMTTATAFGSLWLSSHPGTSSMGKLMALALVSTMAAAVLFQPALMGPPRAVAKDGPREEPKPAAAAERAARVPEPAAWVVRPRDPGKPTGGRGEPVEDGRQQKTKGSCMTTTAEQPKRGTAPMSLAPTSPAPTNLAIDNLRAVVILAVLAFHSVLAYLNFLPPHPYDFDAPPFLWRAFPIVDDQRWFGFDLFCAWLDVFLMSFFFLLSGLFTWPSLARRGACSFLYDRVLRLGLPFAAVVLFLVPLAHYPTYLQSAADPSFAGFWSRWLALPFWPSGPMWFLWLLLVGDAAAAGLFQLTAGRRDSVFRISAYARAHPARFLAGFVVAGAVAYIPLAVVFGSSAWFQLGPFAFQLSRPLHYALYFFAGVVIGACGIERSLIAPDGPLARRWARWLIAALLLFLLWICLTAIVVADPGAASPGFLALDALSFALACFSSCFFVLALAARFARVRSPVLDSLKANAYGMYLVHYGFVVWLQYALLTSDLPAVVKAATVFGGAVLLSWSASASLRRLPAIARIIGAERRRAAGSVRPAAEPSRAAGLAD